jgi:hypothetical protein
MRDAGQRVAQLNAQRVALNQHYLDELDVIDRLKNQRPSWSRDRELRDSLASSLETANQLSAVDRKLRAENLALLAAQRMYLDAIDAELAAEPAAARRAALGQLRAPIEQRLAGAPRKIVIPDLDVDPLADPEELDQRAGELRASEAELDRQLRRLDQADRTGHMPAGFSPEALGEIVDASTIESFVAAQRSSDPAARAEAVHKAHAAVSERLEQVKKTRVELEARSRALRGGR